MNLDIFKDTNYHHKNLDIVKTGIIGLTTYGLQLCIDAENHSAKIEDILELSDAIEGFYGIEEYPQGKDPIQALRDIYSIRNTMNKTDSILKPKGFNSFMMSAVFEIKSLILVEPSQIGSQFTESMVTGLFMFACGELYDIPSEQYTANVIGYIQEIPKHWEKEIEDINQYIDFLDKAVLEMRMKYPNEFEQTQADTPTWEMKM